jgi:hypothetical protein
MRLAHALMMNNLPIRSNSWNSALQGNTPIFRLFGMDEKMMAATEDLMTASLESLFLALRGDRSKEEKVRAILGFHFTND